MKKILRNIFSSKKHDLKVYVPYQPQAASALPTEAVMRQDGSKAAQRPPTENHRAIESLESKLRTSISGGKDSITERRSEKEAEANSRLREYEGHLDAIENLAHEESNVSQQQRRELMDGFDRICNDNITANKSLANFLNKHQCDESIKRNDGLWWSRGMLACIAIVEILAGLILGLEIFQTVTALAFTGIAVVANLGAGYFVALGYGRLNYRKYADKPVLAMLAGLVAWVVGLAIFGVANMMFIAQRIADKQRGKGAEEEVTAGQLLIDATSNPQLIGSEIEAIDFVLMVLATLTLGLAFKFFYNAFGRREANPFLWKHMDDVLSTEKKIKKKNRAASRVIDSEKKKELKKLGDTIDKIGAIEEVTNNLHTAWINDSEKYHTEEREVKEKAQDLAAAYFKSYNDVRMKVKDGERLPNNKLDEWQSRFEKLGTNIINDTDEAKVSDVISHCDTLKKSCVQACDKLKERTKTVNKRWDDIHTGLLDSLDEIDQQITEDLLGRSRGNVADFSDERDRT